MCVHLFHWCDSDVVFFFVISRSFITDAAASFEDFQKRIYLKWHFGRERQKLEENEEAHTTNRETNGKERT